MKELPNSWVVCKLGEVLTIQNGYAFSSKDFTDKGVPLIRQSNLAGKCISLDKCVYLDPVFLETKKDFVLKKNDVLIGMSGSIGKLCIYNLDQPALQNQRTGKINLLSKDIVDWRFIWEYLKTIESELKGKSKGLGINNVSSADIESLRFIIPPLNEQRRIVAKMEKLLAKVDACKERLEKIPAILKRFRQSVLASAFGGALSRDWRSSNPDIEPAEDLLKKIDAIRQSQATTARERHRLQDGQRYQEQKLEDSLSEPLPNAWTECTIGSVGDVQNGSTPSRKNLAYWNGKIPWVSSGEVRNTDIFLTREQISEDGFKNSSVRWLPSGTVLLAMIGEGKTRGQSAILRIKATINQNIAAVVIDHGLILPKYLWYWFQHQYSLTRLMGSGSGPKALNCQLVRCMPLNLAPLEEQHEIVRRVEALFKIADDIEKRYQKAKAHVDRLTQSILAKAFRGELVPQDPADEPASELLKRIQEERRKQAAESSPGRRDPRRGGKSISSTL